MRKHLTEQEEVDRAQEVQGLVGNKYLTEAFDAVKDDIIDQMGQADVGDTDKLVALAIALRQLAKVKVVLARHIETGKLAKVRLLQPDRQVNWNG